MLTVQVKRHIDEYKAREDRMRERICNAKKLNQFEETAALKEEIFLVSQLIEIERRELLQFWRQNKIDLTVKNRLELQLDLRAKHLAEVS